MIIYMQEVRYEHKKTAFWLTPKGLAALGLIGAATYFLLMEHRQHVLLYLPFLILLACPFIHLFMHRGHGNATEHDVHGARGRSSAGSEDSSQVAFQRGLEEGRKQAEHPHKNESNVERKT